MIIMFISLVETIFWLSLFLVFYAYFGYPIVLLLLSFFRNRVVKKGDITPSVSFIITAYNEEKLIRQKIENTLAQDYPRDRFEIIVASDCSSDGTDEIVKTYAHTVVKLVRAPERKGKENAQKCAVDVARGDILVFSDVATVLNQNGVRNIVKGFADPQVGCISSTDKFIDKEGNGTGEGAYVRYEMFLRALESRVNTLVGLSGSFFAVRKELCEPWASNLQSDFNTLINSVRRGYRGICDRDAVGYYPDLTDTKEELGRKVRTIVRGIRVFMRSIHLLNIYRYGFFSWQFCSHKLCRWMVPFLMIVLFICNVITAQGSYFYLCLFILQALFYSLAVIGLVTQSTKPIWKIPSFFVMVNFSILMAWYKYVKGEHYIKWEPSAR